MTTRPHRYLSDDKIKELIATLRTEQGLRREARGSFQVEVNRHRIGRGYGRGFQLAVMRRTASWP
jgi:hypothetical protein